MKQRINKNKKVMRKGLFMILIFLSFFVTSCSQENNKVNDTVENSSVEIREEHECVTDSDCVHEPVCCHRGSTQCIPKSLINEDSLKGCDNVYCTLECRTCTQCKCINGRCVTEFSEGGCC